VQERVERVGPAVLVVRVGRVERLGEGRCQLVDGVARGGPVAVVVVVVVVVVVSGSRERVRGLERAEVNAGDVIRMRGEAAGGIS